jgi:hypothetical protein
MKRIFFILILLSLAIPLIGADKPFTFNRLDRRDDIQNLNYLFDDLYSRKQESSFRVVTTTPTAQTMDYGEVLILKQTDNMRIFIKDDDGNVYYTAVLTAI